MRREGHEQDRSHVTRDLPRGFCGCWVNHISRFTSKGWLWINRSWPGRNSTCLVRDPRIARQREYEGIGYEVRVKLIEHLGRLEKPF